MMMMMTYYYMIIIIICDDYLNISFSTELRLEVVFGIFRSAVVCSLEIDTDIGVSFIISRFLFFLFYFQCILKYIN